MGIVNVHMLWDDGKKAPKRGIKALIIANIETKKQLLRVDESDDDFIAQSDWISNSRFIYSEGSAVSIDGYKVFDAYRKLLQSVSYTYGGKILSK